MPRKTSRGERKERVRKVYVREKMKYNESRYGGGWRSRAKTNQKASLIAFAVDQADHTTTARGPPLPDDANKRPGTLYKHMSDDGGGLTWQRRIPSFRASACDGVRAAAPSPRQSDFIILHYSRHSGGTTRYEFRTFRRRNGLPTVFEDFCSLLVPTFWPCKPNLTSTLV